MQSHHASVKENFVVHFKIIGSCNANSAQLTLLVLYIYVKDRRQHGL